MADNLPPEMNEAALAAMRLKRQMLARRRDKIVSLQERLERDLRRVDSELIHLSFVSKLFGGDLPMPPPSAAGTPVWGFIKTNPTPDGQPHAHLQLRGTKPTAYGGGPAAPIVSAPPDPGPVATPVPKIKQIVLDRLQQAAGRGTRAAEIRQFILVTYGMETHEKTVGMTLYRLLKAGLARREGATWYFVPELDKKGPGSSPRPDLSKLFD